MDPFPPSPALSSPFLGDVQRPVAQLGVAQNDETRWLSWLVAIAASYLAIGMVGVFEPAGIVEMSLSGVAGSGTDAPAPIETTMAELQAQSEPTEPVVTETPPEAIEVPAIEMVETPPLDLPALTEVLSTDDVFTMPAAPRIEEALKPIEPTPAKPVVKRGTSTSQPSASPRTTRSTTGTPGGGGGTAASGSGGKGRFPEPPYPSFAKSRGMQGTCMLTIVVGASGTVQSVSVESSTGFSDLDRHASSWVRRNWRWPAGDVRSFHLPISFRLR